MATANVCIAFLETGLPVWMIESGSDKWMLGMPLLAMNVTFILTNNLAPMMAKHIGNWSVIGIGLLLSAISMIVLPFCRDSYIDGMFKEGLKKKFKSSLKFCMKSFKTYVRFFLLHLHPIQVIWTMYGPRYWMCSSRRWGFIID